MKEITARFISNQKEMLNYIISLPSEFDSQMPVILYLHDFDERGSDIYDVKKSGIHQYTTSLEIPYIIVSPQCHADNFWDYHLYSIEFLLEEIGILYNCDLNRICIIGCGLGAYGGWNYLMQRPKMFKGIVSIAGGVMLKNNLNDILNIPSLIIHGENDKLIPSSESKEIYQYLSKTNADTTLKIVKGEGHKLCNKVFKDKFLYEWLETRL